MGVLEREQVARFHGRLPRQVLITRQASLLPTRYSANRFRKQLPSSFSFSFEVITFRSWRTMDMS